MICVDASVAWKWFYPEEHSHLADELLQTVLASSEEFIAPPLLPSEITNIARQHVRRGLIQLDEAREILAGFLAMPIALQAPATLYTRSLLLAVERGLPATYDAQYLVLSQLLGATFWTADARLVRATSARMPFVRWIGDYQPDL